MADSTDGAAGAMRAGGPAAETSLGVDGREETPNQRADRNWNELLQEVRVTQTSTQILGAFLLAVAFQPRFTELDDYQRALYLVLVAVAALATAPALALVMLHRKHFGTLQKARVVLTGNRLLKANLVIVSVLTAGVASLVFDFVLGRTAGFVALGPACS
ncbi:DUF6328 family protein [Leucobacter allii]|uniref:DUF6328 family protein n=1 Tax=Leucobacter allii TaxID=2932247 RepID=UPI001FD4682F|nr:DUF6328 family protein [Leucobacter allii]UOR03015.1 DUF6328 family protein [Leucobacter allii]